MFLHTANLSRGHRLGGDLEGNSVGVQLLGQQQILQSLHLLAVQGDDWPLEHYLEGIVVVACLLFFSFFVLWFSQLVIYLNLGLCLASIVGLTRNGQLDRGAAAIACGCCVSCGRCGLLFVRIVVVVVVVIAVAVIVVVVEFWIIGFAARRLLLLIGERLSAALEQEIRIENLLATGSS